jgi:hypothetical protein
MKKLNMKSWLILAALAALFTGCYKMQKDYDYTQTPLDPNINKTAKEYLQSRADGTDTIFRWMKKGIEYAGLDWAEYEKPDRSYIFLHNNAIRVLTSGKTTAGFFFDYPILAKDAMGNQLLGINGLDSTRPALQWEEYSQETVKNYLLSLIIKGKYTFENLKVPNTTVETLLPPGTVAGNDSRLSWVIVKTEPNPDPTSIGSIYLDKANGKGFDPEGKMNLKIVNNSNSPLRINDRIDARTAGIIGTNGPIHVFDKTIHPFRYSYP